MVTFILKFLQPYILMQLGMAYSLQQALEGLGINPTKFEPWRVGNGAIVGSMLDVNASLALPILAVLLFSVIWFFLIMRALRVLWSRSAMWLGLLLLVIPGILSIVGAWPQFQWLPRTYVIGSAYVGSPWGMFLLQIFAMTTGWALVVWLTCRLGLDDRFRHGYDQFWYAFAISAGLFFVADLNTNTLRNDLRQSSATSRAASSYLLDQVQRLDVACQSGEIKLDLACEWARSTQWTLGNYAHYGEKLYWQFGPEQEWDIYKPRASSQNDKAIDKLRQELHQYNLQVCPVTDLGGGITQSSNISRTCQITPADFCTSFPLRRLAGMDATEGPLRTVAIANECIIPTLYRLKIEQSSLTAVVDDSDKTRHLRTIFFIFVSFIAGGKVANASVRMTEAIRKANANYAVSDDAPKRKPRFSRWFVRSIYTIHKMWSSVIRPKSKV